MRYRKFGRLDWQVSALGIGLGRLQSPEPDPGRLIRSAIDLGVDYLDLGYRSGSTGPRRVADPAAQEAAARAVGLALADGYRERVRLALTVPLSVVRSTGEFDRCVNEQLEWLGTDRADLCVLSTIDRHAWCAVQTRGLLSAAEHALADGRIGALGFAFRDQYQILRQVMEGYDKWSFVQCEYSYMDVHQDPGSMGLALAADRGLGVVATAPLKGGRLAKDPPEAVARMLAASPRVWSPAEWALRFVWNQPAVSVAVCGVETMDELAQDVALADRAEVGALTVQDELTINRVRGEYRTRRVIDCASCRPCLPCPEGIDIPRIFDIYNDALVYDDVKTAAAIYRDEGHEAELCTGCGLCESRCARDPALPITDLLREASDLLGGRGLS